MAKGEVRYRLTADASGFKKGFDEASKSVNSLASDMSGKLGKAGSVVSALGPAGLAAAAGIGAAAAAAGLAAKAIADTVVQATKYASIFADLSGRTGLSTRALQEYNLAARLTGTTVETIASGVNKMQKALLEGGEAFRRLGLSASDLRRMAPDEAFAKVAEAIKGIKNPTEQAAAAMAVFGKSGAQLLPAIKAGIQEAADEAHRLGLVLSDEAVRAADELGDEADKLAMAWDAVQTQFGAAIAQSPELQQAMKDLTSMMGELAKLIADNKDEIVAFFDAFVQGARLALGVLRPIGQFFSDLANKGGVVAGSNLGQAMEELAMREALRQTKMKFRHELGFDIPQARPGGGSFAGADEDRERERQHAAARKIAEQRAKALDVAGQIKRAEQEITDEMSRQAQLAGLMGGPASDQIMRNLGPQKNLGFLGGMVPGGKPDFMMQTQFDALEEAKVQTIDWSRALGDVAHAFQVLGVSADSTLGRVLGGLTAGAAAMQQFKAAQDVKGLGGLLGKVAGGIGMVGAGISIVKGIFSLFGGKSKEEKEAERRQREEKAAAAAAEAARARTEGIGRAGTGIVAGVAGIGAATPEIARAQATIFTAVFWETFKEKGLVAATDAFRETFNKLAESGAAAEILGPIGNVMAATANEAFRGAAEGAAGFADVLRGLTEAQLPLSQQQMAAFGTQAQAAFAQAQAGALAAGLSVQDANNAALAATAPLLAQIVSSANKYGLEIDAATQGLLDQAAAAGLAFPPDPMERMVELLSQIVGLLGGVASGAAAAGAALGGVHAGGGHPLQNDLIPGMAGGGWVGANPPSGSLRRIGEREPELVIPKSALGTMGNSTVQVVIDGRVLGETIVDMARGNQAGFKTNFGQALG